VSDSEKGKVFFGIFVNYVIIFGPLQFLRPSSSSPSSFLSSHRQSVCSPTSSSLPSTPSNFGTIPSLRPAQFDTMAELYPPSYASRQAYHRHTDPVSPHQQQQQYSSLNGGTGLVYPSQILPSAHSSSNGTQEETPEQPHTPPKAHEPQTPAKSESKPQATFLTKLYAYVTHLYFNDAGCHTRPCPNYPYQPS
jgi:hypothetical protein